MSQQSTLPLYATLNIKSVIPEEHVNQAIETNEITSAKLIVLVSVFLILFGNITFFSNVLDTYPLNINNSLFLLSLAIVFTCVNIIYLSLVCYRYTLKPVLITVLLLSASTAYFMDTFRVIIDDVMIDNILNTNIEEALDLTCLKHYLYLFFLGIVPAIFVYKSNVIYLSLKYSFISRIRLIGSCAAISILSILFLGDFYASFIRENKPLRFYANPSYYIYSTGKFISEFYKSEKIPLRTIGLDANITPLSEHRKLVIFVVGETARADHFSLNGYNKKTNYYLDKEGKIINFNNVWACGTSTSVSVPCMFSIYDRSSYNKTEAKMTENVLDILQRAGINVLWLDNNSNSKGVADRVNYEDYKTPERNPICDVECRDEGMLKNLQTYIDEHPSGDIFIVLHQMGNHGPAYYKRYPSQFEKFIPACQSNQLQDCSRDEITNAYDNAILYTDYFLSKTINILKNNNDEFGSALFYVSDHGESLGENNLYLHGLPYLIAPDAQKHVPMIMWFSNSFNKNQINFQSLKENTENEYSHDNIFHTILGLMDVQTQAYNVAMDFLEYREDG